MCIGRGEVLVLTSFAMLFLMHVYALQEFSHHGQTCEGQPIRQEDADGWSAGISNLLAIHSAEEVIASTTTCKVPSALLRDEGAGQVRSATRPASLHIHLRISSDVYEPYKVLHTYSTRRFNDFLKYAGNLL